MDRRLFMGGALAALVVSLTSKSMGFGMFGRRKQFEVADGRFPYALSDEGWRKQLTSAQYRVLRQAKTEPSRSSPLNEEKRLGIYHCAGCNHSLYSSKDKFESGTGWPSFTQPINEIAVGKSTDHQLFYIRTEIHCANCGGHIGHVFDDGPKPTGLRYCMNGIAMAFKPRKLL